MDPKDSAPAAPQEPVAPVTPAPEAPVVTPPEEVANPNELETELTEEQEQDFVKQILESGDYEEPVKTPEPPVATPPVAEPPKDEPPVVDPPKDPTPEPPVEIPEPQTDDLWIEVEKVVTDDLGEETTELVKLVFDPNDPGSFIPDDFQAKNTKQLSEIMDAKTEMANLYAGRRADFDTAQETKTNETKQQEQLDTWDAEVADLVDAGALPDPKDDKDKFTEKTDAVYAFMTEENTKRKEDGRPLLLSFGTALTKYENSEAVKAAAAEEAQEIKDTKLKGGMIGGGSAASGGSAEPQAYKSGSHKNIWDVPVEE